MPGATALHARCCRTAWNHDERCNHQRVLRSEQPSCQCPCSSLRASVLMHSAAAVCGLSRRSIRLRECHDALAIITRASSAGSQQAEEDKARRVRRASSCPAVPPAVLPDVRRPFDPALVLSLANERERQAACLRDSQFVEVAQKTFFPAMPAVTPSPERAGSPPRAAQRVVTGCGHLCSQHRDHL